MTDFEAFAALAKANGPIGSANLGTNLIALNKRKLGWEVTVGLSNEWGERMMGDDWVGALYLAGKKEFFALREQESELYRLRAENAELKARLTPQPIETVPAEVDRANTAQEPLH